MNISAIRCNVCNWGYNSYIYSEFDASALSFTLGQYPGNCSSGDSYTIKLALVYNYEEDSRVQVTFTFNITIE